MEGAKPGDSEPFADTNVKAPNLFRRAREEIEAIIHTERSHEKGIHDKETHGRNDDIDENTPIDHVRAPNIFERAKEEIEALAETLYEKKESHQTPPVKREDSLLSSLDTNVKAPNLFQKAREEIEAIIHTERSHEKETHGRNDDIDENTPIDHVRAPNIFERAKEEIEALAETLYKKKESYQTPLVKKEDSFLSFLGRKLETCCSPYERTRRRDKKEV